LFLLTILLSTAENRVTRPAPAIRYGLPVTIKIHAEISPPVRLRWIVAIPDPD